MLGLPVYFRADDAIYLSWAHNHSIFDVFRPSTAILIGVFRPVQNLVWWLLYHLFGLNPYPYQLLLAGLFVGSMYFLFKIIQREEIIFPGILAVIAFFAPFHFLLYFLFWYSDLTFAIELFFLTGSVFFLISGLNGQYDKLLWGVLFSLISFFSKEPSVIIIPASLWFYIIGHWKEVKLNNRIKLILLVSTPLVPLLFLKLFPYAFDRAASFPSTDLAETVSYLRTRYEFYGYRLMGFPTGVILLVCTVFLVVNKVLQLSVRSKNLRSGVEVGSVLLAIVSAAVIYPHTGIAYTIFFVSIIFTALCYLRISYAIVWFVLPFLLLLSVEFISQTYLLEAIYGLAIVLAFALSKLLNVSMLLFQKLFGKFPSGERSW